MIFSGRNRYLLPLLAVGAVLVLAAGAARGGHDLGKDCYSCHVLRGGDSWDNSASISIYSAIGNPSYSGPVRCDFCHTDMGGGGTFGVGVRSAHPVRTIIDNGLLVQSPTASDNTLDCQNCHRGNTVTTSPDLVPDVVPAFYAPGGNTGTDGYPSHQLGGAANGSVAKGDEPHLGTVDNATRIYRKKPSSAVTTDYELCLACHNNSGLTTGNKNIRQDYLDKGHYFKTAAPNVAGGAIGDRLPCSVCHESHSSASNLRLFGWDDNVTGKAKPTNINLVVYPNENAANRAICTSCHDDYNSSNAKDTKPLVFGVEPMPRKYSVSGHDNGDTRACSKCHNPHKPPAGGDNCLDCHYSASTSVQPRHRGPEVEFAANGIEAPENDSALQSSGHAGVNYQSPYATTAQNECKKCHGLQHPSNDAKVQSPVSGATYATGFIYGLSYNESSGAWSANTASFGDANGNRIIDGNEFCLSCHDGRTSGNDNVRIGGNDPARVWFPASASDNNATGHDRFGGTGSTPYPTSGNLPAQQLCTSCHKYHTSDRPKLFPGNRSYASTLLTNAMPSWGGSLTTWQAPRPATSAFPFQGGKMRLGSRDANTINYTMVSTPDSGKGFGTAGAPGAYDGLCDACHRDSGTVHDNTLGVAHTHEGDNTAYGSRNSFRKDCVECHNPHGGGNRATPNRYMIRESVGRDNTSQIAVTFTALSGTDSFDEKDPGAEANADDLCATCHNSPPISHNSRTDITADHMQGANCTRCHPHGNKSNAAQFGFRQGACSNCHGGDALNGMPAPGDGGTYHPDANNIIGTRGGNKAAHKVHVDYLAARGVTEASAVCGACHQGGGGYEVHPGNPDNTSYKLGTAPSSAYVQVSLAPQYRIPGYDNVYSDNGYKGTKGVEANAANGWKTCVTTCHRGASPSWAGKTQVVTDNVTFTLDNNAAYATVPVNSTRNQMLAFRLQVTAAAVDNQAGWGAITVVRTGTAPDNAVQAVRIYADDNTAGTVGALDAGDIEVGSGTFQNGIAVVTFQADETIGTTAARYFIGYDIAWSADNVTVGARLENLGAFRLTTPDVLKGTFPAATATPSQVVNINADIVEVAGFDSAPDNVLQGSGDDMLGFRMRVARGNVDNQATFRGLKITLGGSVTPAEVDNVAVYRSVDNVWTAGDAPLGAVVPGDNTQFTVSFADQPITRNYSDYYFVVLNLRSAASWTRTAGAQIHSNTHVVLAAANDCVATAGFPLLSSDAQIQDIPDTLTMTAVNTAPGTGMNFGTRDDVLRLTVSANQDSVDWRGLVVRLTGTAVPVDALDWVYLFKDVGGDNVYSPAVETTPAAAMQPQAGVPDLTLDLLPMNGNRPRTIYAGQPETYFVVLRTTLSPPPAVEGTTVGARVADNGAILLAGTADRTTLSPSPAASDNVAIYAPVDTVAVSGNSTMGLPSVLQGAQDDFLRFRFQVTSPRGDNNATVTAIRVKYAGGITGADLDNVIIYRDVNNDNTWQVPTDNVAGFAAPNGGDNVTVPVSIGVNGSPSPYYFAVLKLRETADWTKRVGATIQDNLSITVSGTDRVFGTGLPLSSAVVPIQDNADLLTVNGDSSAPAGGINQGSRDDFLRLRMSANRDSVRWNGLVVYRTGTAPVGSLDNIVVYRDANSDNTWQSSDNVIGWTVDVPSGSATPVTFADNEVVTTSPRAYFVVYRIKATAAPGQTVGARLADGTAILLPTGSLDTRNLVPTPLASDNVPIQLPGDIVEAEGIGAPSGLSLIQGATGDFLRVRLRVSSGLQFPPEASLTGLSVTITGGLAPTDIDNVIVYRDMNLDNTWQPGVDNAIGWIQPSASPVQVNFAGQTITPAWSPYYFVVYKLKPTADWTRTVGAQLASEDSYVITSPDRMLVPTASLASAMVGIQDNTDRLTIAASSVAPGVVIAGTDNAFLRLVPSVDRDSVVWTGIVVTPTGSNPLADIDNVVVYRDANADGLWQPADTPIGWAAPSAATTVSFSETIRQSVPPPAYFVVYHIRLSATGGDMVGARLADNTAILVSGTVDTKSLQPASPFNSTSARIEELTPPGAVTNFVATPGGRQVRLSWTNPADPDTAGVRVMFRDSPFPTTPPLQTDGFLVCNEPGGAAAADNCMHTQDEVGNPLVNGITYHYAAFPYDNVSNVATDNIAVATATPLAEWYFRVSAAADPSGSEIMDHLSPTAAVPASHYVRANKPGAIKVGTWVGRNPLGLSSLPGGWWQFTSYGYRSNLDLAGTWEYRVYTYPGGYPTTPLYDFNDNTLQIPTTPGPVTSQFAAPASGAISQSAKLVVEVWVNRVTTGPGRFYFQYDSAGQASYFRPSFENVAPAPARETGGGTPIACNTCHQFAPDDGSASLSGGGYVDNANLQYYVSDRGSHLAHRMTNLGADPVNPRPADAADTCTICHASGTDGFPYGHADDAVNMRSGQIGTRAAGPAYDDGGVYDPLTRRCSSTYCHGGQPTPTGAGGESWGYGSTAAQCGVCHAALPATGAHGRHDNTAHNNGASSTSPTRPSNASGYSFSCSYCHYGSGHVNYPVSGNQAAQVVFGGSLAAVNIGSGASYAAGGAAGSENGKLNYTAGSCAVYCHSNANPVGSTNVYDNALLWSGAGSTCGLNCHGNDGRAGRRAVGDNGSTLKGSPAHAAHVTAGFGCNQCHAGTVSGPDNTAIGSGLYDNHVNGVKNVRFSTVRQTGIVQSGGVYDCAARTCSATYCHSSGADNVNFAANPPAVVLAWTDQSACTSCHGGSADSASPIATNAHPKHVNAGFACGTCHAATVSSAADNAIANYASHVNGRKDVQFTGAGSYDGSSGTCTQVACHGGGSVAWTDNNLSCSACHTTIDGAPVGADVDDFVFGTAPMSKIRLSDHTDRGHGNATGLPWNSASNPSVKVTAGCLTCHANTALHSAAEFISNPFRFQSTINSRTVTVNDVDTVCYACHDSAAVKEHSKAITGGGSSGRSHNQKCVDCHDVHGEANIVMVHDNIVYQDNTAADNATSNGFGIPYYPLSRATVVFSDNTTGAGFANSINSPSGPYTGICEVCHTETSQYQRNNNNSKAGPQSHPTDLCVMCHKHAEGFKGSGCYACHGSNATKQLWPDGTGGIPGYADDSAGAHDNHIHAIGAYLNFGDNILAYPEDAQKAICSFCHPNPGGAGHFDNNATDNGGVNRVNVYNASDNAAAYFKKFTGGGAYGDDTGAGWNYDYATRSCSNLACHNQVATPSGAANWGTPPDWTSGMDDRCSNTSCHKPGAFPATGSYTLAHDNHVGTAKKNYACTSCHPSNGTNLQHTNGEVEIAFGGLESTAGGGNGSYSKPAPIAYKTPPYGSCGSVYCHGGDDAWGGTDNTPVWDNVSTASCGTCHRATASTGNLVSSGSHRTHFDNVYGPGLDNNTSCSSACHTGSAITDNTHVDGATNLRKAYDNGAASDKAGTEMCNFCHGGPTPSTTAKSQWDNQTVGNYGNVTCESCHGAGEYPANAKFDNTGAAAPARTANYGSGGHGRTTAYPATNNPAANLSCVACHAEGSKHISGSPGDDRLESPYTREDVCDDCHRPVALGGAPALLTTVAADSRASRHASSVTGNYTGIAQYNYTCVACHDPHGTTNLAMVNRSITDNLGSAADNVSFTGSMSNLDPSGAENGVCDRCHADGGPAHDNTAYPGNHNPGTNCVNCHSHAKSFLGSCTECHGNDGAKTAWPDAVSGNNPRRAAYADDQRGAHDNHIVAIGAYRGYGDNAASYTLVRQTEICAFCHPNPGVGGHEDNNATDNGGINRVSVYNASDNAQAYFRKFTGSGGYAPDNSAGWNYNYATQTCSNLACHNQVTTPSSWNAPPNWSTGMDAKCSNTSCHAAAAFPSGMYTNSHEAHVDNAQAAFGCGECHAGNGTNLRHVDGLVQMSFSNTGSFEQLYGGSNGAYAKGSSFQYKSGAYNYACANVYCHGGDNAWGGRDNTPVWDNYATGGCGACHGDAPDNTSPHAVIASGSHLTHFDSAYGPGLILHGPASATCASCHNINTAAGCLACHRTGREDGFASKPTPTHVDGKVDFARSFTDNSAVLLSGTDICNNCHGGPTPAATAKAQWDNQTVGNYGNVTCESCHGAGEYPANAKVDNTGAPAPARTASYATAGHGRTTSYPVTVNPGANLSCVACHAESSDHINGSPGDDRLDNNYTREDVCDDCHRPVALGGAPALLTTVAADSRASRHASSVTGNYAGIAQYNYTCVACHDPHGTSNLAMVNRSITDNLGSAADNVLFTGSMANLDPSGAENGVCDRCHSDGGQAHDNTAHPGNHNPGTNCINCHSHEKSFLGSCSACHGDDGSAKTTWPDAVSGNNPARVAYTDDQPGAHVNHISAIGAYRGFGDNATGYTLAQQTEVCAFCHPNPGAGGHEDNNATDNGGINRVSVYNASDNAQAYFRKFTGSGSYASDNSAGWSYNYATQTCSNLVCHNRAATPSSWNVPPAVLCTTCHPTSSYAGSHDNHVGTAKKGYACTECHVGNAGNVRHGDGVIQMSFGGLESTAGGGNGSYSKPAPIAYKTPPYGSCSSVYCHGGDDAWGGTDNTPVWDNVSTAACGTCHRATASTGNLVSSGSHRTHFDNVYGPGLDNNTSCSSACHTGYAITDNTHVNGATNLRKAYDNGAASDKAGTEICNICHGGPTPSTTAKSQWDNQTVGNYGNVTCESCHGAGEYPANAKFDNTGAAAPARTASYGSGGHGRTTAYPATNNPAANLSCVACHAESSKHISGSPGDDRLESPYTREDVCDDCHRPVALGGAPALLTTVAADSRASRHASSVTGNYTGIAQYNYTCVVCHDPHGTSNLAMVNRSITDNLGATADNVSFTGSMSNLDPSGAENGVCDRCHANGGQAHDNTAYPGNHNPGTNCINCHRHAKSFFASCTDCHGNSGTKTTWPDAVSGNNPERVAYSDDQPGAHDSHIRAIGGYRGFGDNTAGYTLVQQTEVCSFCHPNPGVGGHEDNVTGDRGGANRVSIYNSTEGGYFKKYTGGGAFDNDTTAGWNYAYDNVSCQNLVCHNRAESPKATQGNWNSPPNWSAGLDSQCQNTTCHGTGTYLGVPDDNNSHYIHVADASGGTPGMDYRCTECHIDQGSNLRHQNGLVEMRFNNAGSLEQTRGGGNGYYDKDGSGGFNTPADNAFAYKTGAFGLCRNIYCHGGDNTGWGGVNTAPTWNDPSTSGCYRNSDPTGFGSCHPAYGSSNSSDTQGGLYRPRVPIVSGNHLIHFRQFGPGGVAVTPPNRGPLLRPHPGSARSCDACHPVAGGACSNACHIGISPHEASNPVSIVTRHVDGIIDMNPVSLMFPEDPSTVLDNTTTCDHCHSTASVDGSIGRDLAKANWDNGSYLLPCLSCHNAADPANNRYNGTGSYNAPAKDNAWTSGGHGRPTAYPATNNPGANLTCAVCHDEMSYHITTTDIPLEAKTDPARLDNNYTREDVCDDCHRPDAMGVPAKLLTNVAAVSRASRHASSVTGNYTGIAQYNYTCVACHDAHGTPNLAMINTSITDNLGATADNVSFTGSMANLDPAGAENGVCDRCHADGGQAHDNTAHPGNHNPGTNCVNCHGHARSFEGSCTSCHGNDGTKATWPDGLSNNPARVAYSDDQTGAHVNHISAIGAYRGYGDNAASYALVRQTEICAFCHPNPGAGGHEDNNATDNGGINRVNVYNASDNAQAYFRKFTGSGGYASDNSAGWSYNYPSQTCSNLVCHNRAATPSSWNTPPAASCTTCHPASSYAGSHDNHVGTAKKAYACTECHPGNAGNARHGDGVIQMSFGGLENTVGGGNGSYSKPAPIAYKASAYGSCSNVYCHGGDDAWGGTDNTPVWDNVSTAACGTCHRATASTGNLVSSGSHRTHFDNVYGPGLDNNTSCSSACHTGYAITDNTHVNGSTSFRTAYNNPASTTLGDNAAGTRVCDFCHGGPTPGGTAKTSWPTETVGNYGNVTCQSCHGGGEYPANAKADNTGVAAPNAVRYYASRGHGSGSLPASGKSANRTCTDCHEYDSGRHIDGVAHSEDRDAQTGDARCTPCHAGIVTHKNVPGNALKTEADFVLACDGCHNPHGTSNIFMVGTIEADDSVYDNQFNVWHPGVRFTAVSGDNSYDEVDDGSTQYDDSSVQNADDVCVTCHYDQSGLANHSGGGKADNVTGHTSSFKGQNCVSCHSHRFSAGGFMPERCNACHDYPGLPASNRHVLSARHGRHVDAAGSGGKNYGCDDCHYDFGSVHNQMSYPADNTNAWDAPDAAVSVRFDNAANPSNANGPTYAGQNASMQYAPGVADNNGTCAGLYCHGNNASLNAGWAGTDNTPEWNTPATAGCGDCHGATATTGNLVGTGSHGTHFDRVYGPAIDNAAGCTVCHVDDSDTGSHVTHVNGSRTVDFRKSATDNAATDNTGTAICNNCHGGPTPALAAKAQWDNQTVGEYGNLTCLSCHGAGDRAGDNVAHTTTLGASDNAAPNVNAFWTASGHGKSGIGKACTDCHSYALRHYGALSSSNPWRLTQPAASTGDLDAFCAACHLPANDHFWIGAKGQAKSGAETHPTSILAYPSDAYRQRWYEPDITDDNVVFSGDIASPYPHVFDGNTDMLICVSCHDPHGVGATLPASRRFGGAYTDNVDLQHMLRFNYRNGQPPALCGKCHK